MKPGEIKIKIQKLKLIKVILKQINVKNTGDRPIQVGSHFHFFEANEGLKLIEKSIWETLRYSCWCCCSF